MKLAIGKMISIFSLYEFPLNLIVAFAFLLAIMIGITFHEYAHGFAALKCGDYTAKYDGRLSLNPMHHFDPIGFLLLVVAGFGWAKPIPVNSMNFTKPYRKSMLWVSSAGVITNLLIAFIAFPLYLVIVYFVPSTFFLYNFLGFFFLYVFSINVTLAVFNFLPIFPLDGFNFAEALLGPYNKFVRFMRAYGMYILLGIFILGAVPFVRVSPISWLVDKVGYPIEVFWEWIFSLFT